MNRFVKVTVLVIVALATVATTIEYASAGDRYWRRHHAVKPWKKRVVVGGLAAGIVAGTVIATRPRVIYRDDPVIVDEPPFYDEEAILGDEDDNSAYGEDDDMSVYADPDVAPDQRGYREPDSTGEDYATPGFEDDEGYSSSEPLAESQDDYFPEKPRTRVERDAKPVERREATVEKLKAKPVRKKQAERREASAADIKPWSKEWKTWCAGKFPSFNPQNGTYLGYDKKRHFCKAG